MVAKPILWHSVYFNAFGYFLRVRLLSQLRCLAVSAFRDVAVQWQGWGLGVLGYAF